MLDRVFWITDEPCTGMTLFLQGGESGQAPRDSPGSPGRSSKCSHGVGKIEILS